MPKPLIALCTPYHPNGMVLVDWAQYTLAHQAHQANQFPPGTHRTFYGRNEGEDCAEAYIQLTRWAIQQQAEYIMYLEDDIYLPTGAIAKLYDTLTRPENKDVAGVGAMYSWRSGPTTDWNLVFERDGGGPMTDFEPGDIVEVDACGQGAFLCRTSAIQNAEEPWFALNWHRDDTPGSVCEGAADLFFFRRLRTSICPHTGKPWRILCDTGITCEHQDRTTKVVYPRSVEFRRRWGYPIDSELLRRLNQQAKGYVPSDPSLISPDGMTEGKRPAIKHVDQAARPAGKPIPIVEQNGDEPDAAALNIGWGGVPIPPRYLATLKNPVVVNLETADGDAYLRTRRDTESDVVGSATDLPFDANAFDLVYCSHVLEHLHRDDAEVAIREMVRVCKRGGNVAIAVPDMAGLGQYVRDQKLDVTLYRTGAGVPITPRMVIWGAQRYPGDEHRNGFDLHSLRRVVAEAGVPHEEAAFSVTNLELRAIITPGKNAKATLQKARLKG